MRDLLSWHDSHPAEQTDNPLIQRARAVINGESPGLAAELDKARRERDALADMLVEIRRIIESPNAPWWMDSPDRGGFDLEAINAALAKAGRGAP